MLSIQTMQGRTTKLYLYSNASAAQPSGRSGTRQAVEASNDASPPVQKQAGAAVRSSTGTRPANREQETAPGGTAGGSGHSGSGHSGHSGQAGSSVAMHLDSNELASSPTPQKILPNFPSVPPAVRGAHINHVAMMN
jgi:hypothetical protein